MIKREQRATSKLKQWLIANRLETAAYEVKQNRGKPIPFSFLAEHQKRSLLIAKHGMFAWKIADTGFINPFDLFTMYKVPAYIVVFFKRNGYLIDVDAWEQEAKTSKRKSLTQARAGEIATCGMIC